MAEFSLREAAHLVGVSRQSVYRMVKEGKLTATLRHDGQKVVNEAELLRVFGRLAPRQSPETVTPTAPETVAPRQPSLQAMTAEDRRREVEAADRAALQTELQAAREALRQAQDQLREAKEREAKLMELAQSATRLLEHREAQAVPKGFWRRVFGG